MYLRYKKGNKNKVDDKTFRKIVSLIFNSIKESLIDTGYFKLPKRLGTLYVIRHEYVPKMKEGKLVGLPPISFNKTLELWEKDFESKRNKILVRHTDTVFYIAKYSSKGGCFPNRANYRFVFRRFLKNSINSYNNGKEAYHTKNSNR